MTEVEDNSVNEMVTHKLFSEEDIDNAIKECNFNKGLGPDGFDGNILIKSNREVENPVADSLRRQILMMLN